MKSDKLVVVLYAHNGEVMYYGRTGIGMYDIDNIEPWDMSEHELVEQKAEQLRGTLHMDSSIRVAKY